MTNKTTKIRLFRLAAVVPVPVYLIMDGLAPHTLAIAVAMILYCVMELVAQANDDHLSKYLGCFAYCLSVPAFIMMAVAHNTKQLTIGNWAEALVLVLVVPFVLHFLARLTESIAEEFLNDSSTGVA